MNRWIVMTNAFVTLVLVGCEPQDKDRLNKIGNLVQARLENALPSMPAAYDGVVETIRTGFPGTDLESHIRVRFRTDQWLQESRIEVSETKPGNIVLTGEVDSDQKKQRALELARTTAGVEAVVDNLKVVEAEKKNE